MDLREKFEQIFKQLNTEESCDIEKIKYLIDNNMGINLLHNLSYMMSEKNVLVIFKILMENNIDINEKNYCGKTALHVATEFGNINMVNILLEHGANCNERANDDYTVLHSAVFWNRFEIVKILLKKININEKLSDGKTSLHIACQYHFIIMIELLLQNGIDIYAENIYFENAFDIALKTNDIDVIKILLEYGLTIDLRCSKYFNLDENILNVITDTHINILK